MEKSTIMEYFQGATGKILISLCEIIIGVLLFINPTGFTNGIIIACGAVMLLLGLANIVKYFTSAVEVATTEKTLFSGLLLLIIGGFCAFNSQWFVDIILVISILYGVVLVLMALNSIQTAVNMIRLKDRKWYLELINAIVLVAVAIIIFVNPFGDGKGIWIFIGVVLIVSAVYNIVEMFLLSKSPKQTVAQEENVIKEEVPKGKK